MKRLIPCLEQDKVEIELILLIKTILTACKEISFRVGQGALSNVLGSTLDENIQGETQKNLDIISNQLLKDMLLESGKVRTIASEEEDYVVAATENAPYIVAFDFHKKVLNKCVLVMCYMAHRLCWRLLRVAHLAYTP